MGVLIVRFQKASILFVKSVERKPPQDGRAYKIREAIIAHATVAITDQHDA